MESSDSLRIEFDAMEYQADRTFKKISYAYQGSEYSGWKIFRNKILHLELPAGYRLLKTIACGICSTDIARANLPFALPQVTGHEIIALDGDVPVVVEINDSHYARGEETACFYCNNRLANHCPQRLTLGIDRLPGGFAPYILAPRNSIYPLPKEIDDTLAVITEPLAAAIRAVEKTPLDNCRSIAVVGPRRLGSLILLVLKHFREQHNLNFTLTAIIRNEAMEKMCYVAGADEVLSANNLVNKRFDIVFDTSGSSSGFDLSLAITEKYVHLKSTNGQDYDGLKVLTELVINEIGIYPIDKHKLESLLNSNLELLIDQRLESNNSQDIKKHKTFLSINNSIPLAENSTGLFDAVVLVDINDLNVLLASGSEKNRLMPEGKVYLPSINELKNKSRIQQTICEHKITLLTSRCGDFTKAIEFMQQHLFDLREFQKHFLTHVYNLENIESAFYEAQRNADCIKAVIRH